MKGILFLNTGTPKSERSKDVGRFIGDMLSDGKVLDLPNPFRWMLARWIIAPLRRKKSAAHYQLIWNYEHNSSPLKYHTQLLCKKLQQKYGAVVGYAFRYGSPNVTEAILRLEERIPEMDELVVMPLFPHFAQSGFETAVDEVAKFTKRRKPQYRIRIIPLYYNHPEFIKALSFQVKPFTDKPYDKLLFSYHSLPLRHLEREKGRGAAFDYIFQTEETMRLVVEHLGLNEAKNQVVYSSAIGKNWKEPFLEDVVAQLPANGCKNIVVVCAGFPTDNLESLYDIGVESVRIFKSNGGENLWFVPGLNSEDVWVDALWTIINLDVTRENSTERLC